MKGASDERVDRYAGTINLTMYYYKIVKNHRIHRE